MSNYPSTLRAISIINLFGWEICIGIKPYEFRTWDTSFRGLCLIHVSASREFEDGFDEFLEHGEITREEIAQMRKHIIGFATVTKTLWSDIDQQYAYKMENPALFDGFIPCPGVLNYWTPHKNRPEQTAAFQKAWDMINTGAYVEAHPDDYRDSLIYFNLEDVEENISEKVLITPALL